MGTPCRGIESCECRGKTICEKFELYKPLLAAFKDGGKESQIDVLRRAPPCFVRLVAETGLNILKGNLRLPKSQYRNLRPHKHLLLSLSKPGISLERKKQLLIEKKGGFLPTLVPILLSALASFAGQALAKTLV